VHPHLRTTETHHTHEEKEYRAFCEDLVVSPRCLWVEEGLCGSLQICSREGRNHPMPTTRRRRGNKG